MSDDKTLSHLVSRHSVSSVYNRNTVSYGKQHLFDKNRETCWNSEQGTPQHIQVEFKVPVKLAAIRIQFQGGFAGKSTNLFDMSQPSQPICPLHPKDDNTVQVLALPEPLQDIARTRIKIQFLSSTDFYGRIIVYSLDFIGHADSSQGTTVDGPLPMAAAAA
ncbi:Nuclear receptor 2C2-associated protein [Coemansia sp. RSA 2671]|uniref:Nuclear receptor 2C2-associated protein n=1 Tax=Coemansia spiralis TaxID=417178 RepID=A0A9W8GC30_9FUNG|nr:Nuclear receptor 2C2-associated protein [Coemansia sp. RSA 2675]KAJ2349740.1 Nuclear receptor 2C2-associated protein [Coemansia sp. RSA 2671]KAJ2410291.1 Nuclear receptor 2C2-associated protein [Coemansia sp. RSA 2530]KAJ2684483.1 Nuclear receptor 2C2-associated protein [Coemansia spiralis]KAJ2702990.1 Nuclear receptor 2C2-associated protein [Coemansia sp. IMI 209128]